MSFLQYINSIKSQFNPKNFNIPEKKSLNYFMLTPIESLLINRKMPHGYKLVLDNKEDINIDINIEKKLKESSLEEKVIPKLKSKRRIKSKKKTTEFKEYFKNIQNEKNSLIQKCRKCLDRILSETCSKNFYNQLKNKKIPSLLSIKKKVANNKYNNSSEFFLDLRNIWNYYLKKYPSDSKIFNNSYIMSQLTEELYNQFDNINEDENYGNNLKKNIDNNCNLKKKKKNKVENKVTVGEKNALGIAIRCLNKDQLKGFVKLLKKFNINEIQKGEKKYVEFNIDKLSNHVIKNLKLYVEECGIIIQNIYQYNRISKEDNNNNNNINNNNINNNNNNINNLKTSISEIEELKNNFQKEIITNDENEMKSENRNLFDINSINSMSNSNNLFLIEKKNEYRNQDINIYADIEKLLSSSEENSQNFSDF